jgi:hypothetical protein
MIRGPNNDKRPGQILGSGLQVAYDLEVKVEIT